MNVEKDIQIAAEKNQVELQRIQTDTDRDNVYAELQANRDESTQNFNLSKLELTKEIAMLDYANREKVSLDKVKADLAKKAMDIQSTKELAGIEAPASMLPTPPVEPPQQAPEGESFTQ